MNQSLSDRIHSIEDFRMMLTQECHGVDCLIDHGGQDGPLGQTHPTISSGLENRFCINPVLIGDADSSGLPSPATMARWQSYGAGGASITWSGELFAVSSSGRCHPGQMILDHTDKSCRELSKLRRSHRCGALQDGEREVPRLVGIELSHAGRYVSEGVGQGVSADARYPTPEADDARLCCIRDEFIASATQVQRAGFDFVALDVAHGHLLHDSLSAYDRPGPFGGDLENRTRLLREIVEGIQSACPDLRIGIHATVTDPLLIPPDLDSAALEDGPEPGFQRFGVSPRYPGQADLLEPFGLIAMFQIRGVSLFNISVGSPYQSPELFAPGSAPRRADCEKPAHPLTAVQRHLEGARACKQRYPDLVVVGGGYSWLRNFLPHVAAMEIDDQQVDFVGLGRISRSYPELPRDFIHSGFVDGTRMALQRPRDAFTRPNPVM